MVMVTAQANGGGGGYAGLLWLVFIALAFYLFVLRPNRRRMRVMQEAQAALEPGREIVTTAGIYGTILSVDADTFTLETAPGVTMRMARAAVMKVVPLPSADTAADGAGEAGTGEV